MYGHGYGISFTLFGLLLVACVSLSAVVSGKRGNAWAYLFTIPLFLALMSEAMYESGAARFIAVCTAAVSLALFAYWFAAPPIRLRDVRFLWPLALMRETALPFSGVGTLFRPLLRNGHHRRWKGILLGTIVALPFLLIFLLLFVGADGLFREALSSVFAGISQMELFQRTVTDTAALLFFTGAAWTVFSRLWEGRRIPEPHKSRIAIDQTVISTFLVLLNALFLTFIAFQFVYFFGGASVVQDRGLTYATYAREGFFQLLAVSALVAAIVAALYRAHALHERVIRMLGAALIVETGVVIASAVRRMALYVDAYGLTLDRYWALAAIVLIAAGLAFTLIGMIGRLSFSRWSSGILIGGLIAVSILNILDTEGFIARFNVDRFLSGNTTQLDLNYLEQLSADTVPALARLAASPWPTQQTASDTDMRREVLDALKSYRQALVNRTDDWRGMTFSRFRALTALVLVGESSQ